MRLLCKIDRVLIELCRTLTIKMSIGRLANLNGYFYQWPIDTTIAFVHNIMQKKTFYSCCVDKP